MISWTKETRIQGLKTQIRHQHDLFISNELCGCVPHNGAMRLCRLSVFKEKHFVWLFGDFHATTLTNLAMCSPFPSIEALDGYKRWLFEILNPPLLGVLVRITFIDSIKFPLHLSSAIPLRYLPVSVISLHTFSPILILFCCSCSHSPPASLQNVFYPSY